MYNTITLSKSVSQILAIITLTFISFLSFNNTAKSQVTASFIPGDTSMCGNGCIFFASTSTGNITSYNWTFPGGFPPTSNNPNQVVCFVAAGTYTVSLTVSDGGSTQTATHTVVIKNCADWSASDSVFCLGTCINFTDISGGSPVSWSWNFPGATPDTSTLQNPTNICYNSPGNWDVTLTVNYGGSNTSTITKTNFILVGACPIANFTSDKPTNTHDSLCACKCIHFTDQSLNMFNPNRPTSWNWTFGAGASPPTSTEQNPTVCFTPGTYNITLLDSNNVGTNSKTVLSYLIVYNCSTAVANIGAGGKDTICAGECINIIDTSCNNPVWWRWSIPGGTLTPPFADTTQNPGVVCFNTPGTYNITLTDSNNFAGQDVAHYRIVVKPLPSIHISSIPENIVNDTITLITGTTVVVTASGNEPLQYSWFTKNTPDSNFLSCDTTGINYSCGTANNIKPTRSGWYYVTTIGDDGCSALDSFYIHVVPTSDIYVPTAFSPNGDGYNDVLWVRSKFIKTFTFAVYNRWGQNVFETNAWAPGTDHSEGWDGYFNGTLVNNGVFDWYVKATLFNGKQVVAKGTTTVVR